MNYYSSMQQVLNYIEDNIAEEISLDNLAALMHLSRFHFHRIFQAMVGTPLMEYVRLRRLTLAGQQLRLTDRRIVDIAFEYQFNSHETFSRAFKKAFGFSPNEYRGLEMAVPLKGKVVLPAPDTQTGGFTLEPKIVTKDAFTVVGLECITTQEDNNTNFTIPKLWSNFVPRMSEIKNRANNATLGLCVSEGLDVEHFSYISGVEVTAVGQLPQGMIARSVPDSRYLVFTHKGSADKLGETYDFIYGKYIPAAGHEIRSMVDFELYDERFHPDREESEIDIYIPIK